MTKKEIIDAGLKLLRYGETERDTDNPMESFIKGAEFMDNHWKEKTRWIPVEEKLPPRGDETRQVFVKNVNKYKLNWMIVSCFDDDYPYDIEVIKREFTHWKELE